MPLLLNARWERFAQERAKGVGCVVAYQLAGYTGQTLRKTPYDLDNRPEIKRRVVELIERRYELEEESTRNALEKAEVTKYSIVMELKHIAMTRPNHIFEFDADGNPTLDMDELSAHPDRWAAIKDVIVEEYPVGRGDNVVMAKRVKVVLHDKQAALRSLAAMHNMVDKNSGVKVGVAVQVVMNEDELRA